MERILKLGDANVGRVGLGSNRLTNTPANVAFIRAAVGAGLNFIDTAHTYAGGESEETIGAALAGSSGSKGTAVVATKGGMGAGQGRPDALRAQIETSLRRLRTDTIALYYLHRVDPETPLAESLGAIREAVDRGQIQHVGLCQVTIEQIERARMILPIAAVQSHYNLSERNWDDVVDYCTREGIWFVPYFPLHGDRGAELTRIAEMRGATPSQIAIAWLLQRSPTMLPIPGTLSLPHVKENLAALDIELTDAEFQALL
jgi:aryl-alcohol dehydrogenase-like predicted oxidoreductase